jgi:multidrug resistance efflux pump
MKRLIPLLIIIGLLTSGYYWWQNHAAGVVAAPPQVAGWGTIETETLLITPQLGGQIVAIFVAEGDEVSRGQVLIELDGSLWQAQRRQLEAAVALARANLAEVKTPPRPQEIAVAEAELARVEAARDGAYQVWQTAQSIVTNPLELNAQIEALRGQLPVLEQQLEAAQAGLKEAEITRDEAYRNQSSDEAITTYQAAAKQAEAAQGSLAAAQAGLAGARSQLDLLVAIRDNPLTLKSQANTAQTGYQQAAAAVQIAEAQLASVKAGPRTEAVAIAQAQLKKAEAALARLELQLDKLSLTAPIDAIVLEQPAQPGELAAPGVTLLKLGDLNQVTLKVFVPETEIGLVRLGHPARVRVDAYAAETFAGVVTFIAQEAEFTPQNVQTKEERVNLVFAVKISLDNPEHRLKPGMPAGAEILVTEPVQGRAASPPPASNLAPAPSPSPESRPRLATPTRPQAVPSPTPAAAAEILAWGLNVRSGPGIDYPVTATLAKGDVVPVLEVDPASGWLQIELPAGDQTGWITASSNYVSIRN